MKIIKIIKSTLFIAVLLVNTNAFAYSPDETEQVCKKPHFTDFSLPIYKTPENLEVPPETEFFFKLSVWADPSTIKLTAKKKPLPFTVESTSSFHKVKAKIPADFTGSFVRLDARVKALLGCSEQIGWLVKIADK